MKIGRNKPCICGSGKKYKKCCYGLSENEILKKWMELNQQKSANRRSWPTKHGNVDPFPTGVGHGDRYIGIGSKLHRVSANETWHEFLCGYLRGIFGSDWFKIEAKKTEVNQHILARWSEEVNNFSGNITVGIPAFRSVAFDLMCIDQRHSLSDKLISRLKHRDQFEGARYELWVKACFFRAGFKVQDEDEDDRSRSHCEFVVHHMNNNKKYSVEVKRRQSNAMRIAHQEGEPIKFKITSLISAAAKKYSEYDKIIFIDVNMPPEPGSILDSSWIKKFEVSIKKLEKQKEYCAINAPKAFLFISNHPYHYLSTDKPNPKTQFLATAFNIPEYRNDKAKVTEDHPDIMGLAKSINQHFFIPEDFPDF